MILNKIKNFLVFFPLIIFILYFMEHTGTLRDIILEHDCKSGWSEDADIYVNRDLNHGKENENVKVAKKYILKYYSKIKQKNRDISTHDALDVLENPSKYYGEIIDIEGDVLSAHKYVYYDEENEFDIQFKEKTQFVEIALSNYTIIQALLVSNKYIDNFYKLYEKDDYVFARGFIVGRYKTEDGRDYIAFVGIVI